MSSLEELLCNNRAWAEEHKRSDPRYFERLAKLQEPEYLWIGCSDSRVPANQVIGVKPGEVFVHRNVGNVVAHSDLNALSAIHYAVDALQVKHIIVCGHYGCGAVQAAAGVRSHGVVDNWLIGIRELYESAREELETVQDVDSRQELMCELNVWNQVRNVCKTTAVRDAWKRGLNLEVHGWIYGIHDGLIRDLGLDAHSPQEAEELRHLRKDWITRIED